MPTLMRIYVVQRRSISLRLAHFYLSRTNQTNHLGELMDKFQMRGSVPSCIAMDIILLSALHQPAAAAITRQLRGR